MNSSDRYSENNSWGARLSVDWRPSGGHFKTYTVADYYNVDQAATAFALVGANTSLPMYNLPASIDAPDGMTVGTARFGAACTAAFNAGITASVDQCIDERLQIAAQFRPAAEAEVARLTAGDDAWRYTPGGGDLDLSETMEKWTLVNQSEIDFGKVGFTELQLRNIFGYQSSRGATGWNVDGLGGLIQSSISVTQTASYAFTVTAQQDGAHGYTLSGPWQEVFSNETQLRGSIADDFLTWSVGGYYQLTPGVTNLDGIRNLSRVWSGTTLPTQGYNPSFPFSDGGETTQKAVFGQATVDISSLAPVLTSLKLTGGLRKSWDESELFTRPVTTDIATGKYVPLDTRNRYFTKSDGENSTLSLDAQLTPDLLVYAATRKGYRPGGINSVLDAEGLPGYSTVYAPETVEDVELGAKYDFAVGGVRGRINGALYQTDYKDIQRTFSASVNGVTTTYIVNASAAEINGLELQGQAEFGNWGLFGTYAYTDAKFTEWAGADPLAQIRPGNSRCLPQSTAAICLIDLSDNPFPNIPEQQGSLTAQYFVPMSPDLGEASVQLSAYTQSRRYFNDAAQRNVEAFGESVRDAISQPAFSRFNFRADWKNVMDSNISVGAFINNLTDEGYATGAITQLHSLGTAVKSYAEPRTFGIELRYEFGS
ncbi:MAG: TonB-dependent receptor [Hyphomonadaceae bacterium]